MRISEAGLVFADLSGDWVEPAHGAIGVPQIPDEPFVIGHDGVGSRRRGQWVFLEVSGERIKAPHQ